MAKCPICNEDVRARAENAAFPFCSSRCKTVDLGKWLSEEYRVPAEPDDDIAGSNESLLELDDSPVVTKRYQTN